MTEPTHNATDDAVDVGMAMARKVFAKRGNHSEIHLSEGELAGLLGAAYSAASETASTSSLAEEYTRGRCDGFEAGMLRAEQICTDVERSLKLAGHKDQAFGAGDCVLNIRLKNAAPQATGEKANPCGRSEPDGAAPAVVSAELRGNLWHRDTAALVGRLRSYAPELSDQAEDDLKEAADLLSMPLQECLTIGDYTIRPSRTKGLWIEHKSGEGMHLPQAELLAAVIDKFYQEHF